MIYLGPAGVPLSCKGRTVLDAVKHVHDLGLNAMEVQFVRGIRMDDEYAKRVRGAAEELDVLLAVHAPYYTNLGSDEEKTVQRTVEKVLASAHAAHIMGAGIVVAHPGFYTSLTKRQTYNKVVKTTEDVAKQIRSRKYKVKLGLEVMGKQQTFGTLEEVVRIASRIDGAVPVLDFAHIHARGGGSLKTYADFQKVFDTVEEEMDVKHLHGYFTGNRYENNNELHHVPIKKGDMDFSILAEVILDGGYNMTLISISPIIEHDAMYMKILLEKVLEKRGEPLSKHYKIVKREEATTP